LMEQFAAKLIRLHGSVNSASLPPSPNNGIDEIARGPDGPLR
jgi:hypothetical protein